MPEEIDGNVFSTYCAISILLKSSQDHILDILGFTILISFDLLIYTPEN